MRRFSGLKRGRAVLVRIPHVVDGRDPPRYFWHIGKVLAVWKKGVRIAIIDIKTLETRRIIELSHCSLDRWCSLGMEITLPS